MPLVVHIIKKNFSWAITDVGTGSFEKTRRAVDAEDLAQVGLIALMEAWEGYDKKHESKSSFKTYAYRVIYNRLLNYLDDNCTPISTSRRRQILTDGSDDSKKRLMAATNYRCFSEISSKHYHDDMDEIEYNPTPSREESSIQDPAIRIDNQEFSEHCIEKLKKGLTPEEWRVLMLRYSGGTYKEIGETVSLSYESIRNMLESLNYKIRHILFNEIEEFGIGNNTDKSLSYQAHTARRRVPRVHV